jgi:hypothetical protein
MLIRKVDRYTYDVFGDVGFDNWSRVHKFPWGYKVVKGNRLEKELLDEVITAIQQNPRGSLHNVTVIQE